VRSRRGAQLLDRAFSFVESLIRVHPTRSARCHFISLVLPTKHLFDHYRP
jgi:hypothetical protein